MMKRIVLFSIAIANMFTLNSQLDQKLKSIINDAKKMSASRFVKNQNEFPDITQSVTTLNKQLDDLLNQYITSHKTKGINNTDTIMQSATINLFIDAYNYVLSVNLACKEYPIPLDQNDFNQMSNKNLLGAVLFIPEMTVNDYNLVMSGRLSLAVAAKNAPTNREMVCATTLIDRLFAYLTVHKPLTSLDFADQYDIDNKNSIHNACKNFPPAKNPAKWSVVPTR